MKIFEPLINKENLILNLIKLYNLETKCKNQIEKREVKRSILATKEKINTLFPS